VTGGEGLLHWLWGDWCLSVSARTSRRVRLSVQIEFDTEWRSSSSPHVHTWLCLPSAADTNGIAAAAAARYSGAYGKGGGRRSRREHRPPKGAREAADQARSVLPVDGLVPGAHRRLVAEVDRLLTEELVAPLKPLVAAADRRQVHHDVHEKLVGQVRHIGANATALEARLNLVGAAAD